MWAGSTRVISFSLVVVSSALALSSMSLLFLYIIDGSSIMSLPSTRNLAFSTLNSFGGVSGREETSPEDVAVAIEINCWLLG